MIFFLINQLQRNGVALSLDSEGHLKANLPWPVNEIPPEVRLLLHQVKERRSEVEEALSWDENEAFTVYRAATKAVSMASSKPVALGALPWARRHRPELEQAVRDTEQAFNRAYDARNMAGVIAASAAMEQAGMAVCGEFKKAVSEILQRRKVA
jgi:hypothetical protein